MALRGSGKRHGERVHYGYEGARRGSGSKGPGRDRDDGRGNDDAMSSMGSSAARMGGMPMGGMYGGMGGGGASASEAASPALGTQTAQSVVTDSAYSPDASAESAGVVGTVGGEPEAAPAVDPVDLGSGGGGGGAGAPVDAPRTADMGDVASPVAGDVGGAASSADAGTASLGADASTVDASAVAGPVGGVQAGINAGQPVDVLDLRNVFQSMGFSDKDSDVLTRVIADGKIDSSELEDLSNVQYPNNIGGWFGNRDKGGADSADTPAAADTPISADAPASADTPVAADAPAPADSASSESPVADASVAGTDSGAADVSSADVVAGNADKPTVHVTMDKDGNVRISRDGDHDGNPDMTIDIDKDNNVEFNSYDKTQSGVEADSEEQSGVEADGEEQSGVEADGTKVVNSDKAESDGDADKTSGGGSSAAKPTPTTSPSSGSTTGGSGSSGTTSSGGSSGAVAAGTAAAVGGVAGTAAGVAGSGDGDAAASVPSSNAGADGAENVGDSSTGDSQDKPGDGNEGDQNNKQDNTNTGGQGGSVSGGSSDFELLSTEYFDDAELAAKKVAETVRDLKRKIQEADFACNEKWLGKGHKEFRNLAYTVEIQLKDISNEFWEFYEELIDAHDAYLTADEEAATEVNSVFG